MKKIQFQRWITWLAALLFLLLIVLTVATITVIQHSSSMRHSVPFNLDRITAQQSAGDDDISDLLLPAFIGITTDGTRRGISASPNIAAELYRTVLPILAETLSGSNVSNGDSRLWSSLPDKTCSVYIRYHHELPDYLLHTLAGGETSRSNTSYVYEMFLLPYAETDDSISVVTRSMNGSISVYTKKSPDEIVTADDLRRLHRSYRSNLTEFDFAGENPLFASVTEPIFKDSVTTRNIIITSQTASLVQNSQAETDALLRLFGLNPDKLLNRHIESDGTGSYIDRKGIMYLRNSSFEYSAVQDGGVPVSTYIGTTGNLRLADYLRASVKIYEQIRAVNRHFTGGDADLTLASVTSSDNVITVTYEYTFDNIRITGIEPALTVTFANGKLTSAKLYTIAIRNLGDRTESIAEWWFADYLSRKTNDDSVLRDISLVYRSDFISESVRAEWSGAGYTVNN